MFRILSRQTHIFSIPSYLIVLILFISIFNVLNFSILGAISSFITFIGIALGYFAFKGIGMTENLHLPLFLYTLLVFSIYFGGIDLGLAITILGAHLIIVLLVNQDTEFREHAYFLIGCITMIMYLVNPESWPFIGFILAQIFLRSRYIVANIFRLLFAGILIFITYLCVLYLFDIPFYYQRLIPYISNRVIQQPGALLFLIPIVLFLLYSLIDGLLNRSKQGLRVQAYYNLIIVALTCPLLICVFYMEHHYEYLLLMALPCSIIISRGLRFLKKPVMQEVFLWVIILSALLFKGGYYFYS